MRRGTPKAERLSDRRWIQVRILAAPLFLVGCGAVRAVALDAGAETDAPRSSTPDAPAARPPDAAAEQLAPEAPPAAQLDASAPETAPEAPPARVCSAVNYGEVCANHLDAPRWVCVAACRDTAGVAAWPRGAESCAAELRDNSQFVCVESCGACPAVLP